LAVTLAAAVFFGEPVGWRRYLAIAVGFAGVLIIVRPGSEGFTVYSLWAMASVGFVVLRDLATRRLSAAAPGPAIVFATSLAMTLTAGALTAATEWRPMEIQSLASLSGSALFLLVGYHFSVNSMRTGEIGFVQPFRYTLLIWATLLGIVMFGEWPDFWTLLGGAIVVATGLFMFYRERRVIRSFNG
jgi:drug/metabolite transporter (DMT)-like permease